MAPVDKDWIKKQFAKVISAEQSILKAEKDHRDRMKDPHIINLYDKIVREDELHLDELKQVADKYGYVSGEMMTGSVGGLLGGLKSALEDIGTSDPFQAVGDDLIMKSNAVNYDQAWTKIFRTIGDEESARALEIAAQEDEEHQSLMRQALTSVGLMEARGEKMEED